MSHAVVGLGNALMDALILIDSDKVLTDLGLVRGTTQMVSNDQWQQAYDRFSEADIRLESGGSCANTIATLGRLGADSIYAGQVGSDDLGKVYMSRVTEACGQHAVITLDGGHTGKCLSLVSRSDAERTMMTDLGCAVTLSSLDHYYSVLGGAKVAHFTGYTLLGDPMQSLVVEAMKRAKEQGSLVSLDVADPFVVSAVKDLTWQLLETHVDVVFLNAEEARALTGEAPEHAGEAILKRAPNLHTVVVKLGGKGSVVYHGGERVEIDIHKVEALDTTGAGDAYAGGYLYGLINGWTPTDSGNLASRVAAVTVAQLGAVVKDNALLAQQVEAVR